MPVSRLASGTDILTMAAATLILTMDTTDRTTGRTTTVGRHFTGIAVIAFTIRECTAGTIGFGTKPKRGQDLSRPAGVKKAVGFFFFGSLGHPAPKLLLLRARGAR